MLPGLCTAPRPGRRGPMLPDPRTAPQPDLRAAPRPGRCGPMLPDLRTAPQPDLLAARRAADSRAAPLPGWRTAPPDR